MTGLPDTQALALREDDGVLHVVLNRPERRNALSSLMIDELCAVFAAASADAGGTPRAIVLRGAAATFCAGADVKELGRGLPSGGDPRRVIAAGNRRFGELLTTVQQAAQPVVAVVEGAVRGGGLGLVCASDVALAHKDASFALPETGLGLVPAQIAPFVVQRVGLTQARRLMLTGARFDGAAAQRIGLVHEVCDDAPALEACLAQTLRAIRRCAPAANAATKRLLLGSLGRPLPDVLDEAAEVFATAQLGDEAREGTAAFLQKRPPSWAK